ncbi:hypothetical protein L2E82_05207 [Cichorium intybus]|uniref:Uncharacterized protein n=1 Tax=Cichorium intybus TaxID=13427 RepID=A0ACB9H6G5_CICIN|nr:hypothetical protein L2E82_05207 [Cichorium intybus]
MNVVHAAEKKLEVTVAFDDIKGELDDDELEDSDEAEGKSKSENNDNLEDELEIEDELDWDSNWEPESEDMQTT